MHGDDCTIIITYTVYQKCLHLKKTYASKCILILDYNLRLNNQHNCKPSHHKLEHHY